MKKTEYLPVVRECNRRFLVDGKIERKVAHSIPSVPHATVLIIPVFPDGKLLIEDRAEKHRMEGKFVPENGHVYNCFGGHMQYDDIPKNEYKEGIRVETFQKCAYRELSEELVCVSEQGYRLPFVPIMNRFIPISQYSVKSDTNKEYSWLFLYLLEDYGPYGAQDTVMTEQGEKLVYQSARVMTWEKLWSLYKNKEILDEISFSDGIERILERNEGYELHFQLKHIANVCDEK